MGGRTTALAAGDIASWLALPAQSTPPTWVLYNIGANDVTGVRDLSITEGDWETNTGAILDAMHTKWPGAKIRLMRVARPLFATEANTLAAWQDVVLSTRSSFAAAGPDERTFLPGHMEDDAHPNATGYSLTAAQWQALILTGN